MTQKTFSTSLIFDGFALDFDVDIIASKEFTNRFSAHGPDFIFAVAEVWLDINGKRYLIISSMRPANLIEALKLDLHTFSAPAYIPGLEQIIPYGGWCSWMSGYWKRFNDDVGTSNDEAIYDELIKLEFMSSKNGHAAIYNYNGTPTIEIAAFIIEKDIIIDRIHVVSKFSINDKIREISGIITSITNAVRRNNPRKAE